MAGLKLNCPLEPLASLPLPLSLSPSLRQMTSVGAINKKPARSSLPPSPVLHAPFWGRRRDGEEDADGQRKIAKRGE